MLGFLKSRPWSLPGSSHPEAGSESSHRAEAQRQIQAGNYAEAEIHLLAAVEDADKRGLSPAQRIAIRLELAEAQNRLGSAASEGAAPDITKLHTAENTLRGTVVLCVQASDSRLYLNCLDALAGVLFTMKNFPAVEQVGEDAVRLGMSLASEDAHRKEARVYRLAVAQYENGHVDSAIASFEKAIALREKAHGASHVETGNLLAEVGRLCLSHGDHPKAQAYLGRALRIHEAECGVDSPEANRDTQELARSLEESGDTDAAATQYERALMLKLRKLGCGNIDEVAEMQYHLANLHVGWGNLSRARELLEDCAGTFRRTGGARLAVVHETLAQVEEKLGRVSFAVEELEKAGKAWEKCGPSRIQELVGNLEYRADLLDQLRQRREANWLRKQAADLLAGNSDLTVSAKTA